MYDSPLKLAAALTILTILSACARHAVVEQAHPTHAIATTTEAPLSEGLILGPEEGERRVRRFAGSVPFILKIDKLNGKSPDLVMGQEDLPAGQVIATHRHLIADEIVIVSSGNGTVYLGQRESAISAGSIVYIPKNQRISFKSKGPEPMRIMFIFSKPGFEEQMRLNSVMEGDKFTPTSRDELTAIRKRGEWHTIYDSP